MGKTILLKNIPSEIKKIIDGKQKEEREKLLGGNFSKDRTIYRIIKEWAESRQKESLPNHGQH